jgi:hypothetical protein
MAPRYHLEVLWFDGLGMPRVGFYYAPIHQSRVNLGFRWHLQGHRA